MTNLNSIIFSAFENYDIKNNKYNKYINSNNVNINIDELTIEFVDYNESFFYQILGTYQPKSHLWLWAWMIPRYLYKEIKLCRELLEYGLKQSNITNPEDSLEEYKYNPTQNEDSFLKVQLVNSRFIIRHKFQLDLHLAVVFFLLKDKILFIYARKKPEGIIYYMICKDKY